MSTTITLTTIEALRNALQPHRSQKTIALVPTMGNLHQGHISLVKLAKQHADIVVVSIFVNPTQFGVGEDLDSYPRTLEADTELLAAEGVDYIFAPTVEEMYPLMPPPTQVLAGSISQQLCGQSRPTHFDGVGIVVTKLFNIVQPNVAVFGKKDYQQLAIIKQLVRDLSFDIKLIGGPIIRTEDGLALSSRNQYLTEQERSIAPLLNKHISQLADQLRQLPIDQIEQRFALINDTKTAINQSGFEVDYLEVRNQDLTNIDASATEKAWVVLVAAWLGKARLLDNQEV
ncbi:pantoate--beta-alanine ligase [Psychrobacter sp. FDAARGOS_221]|uniref:pantoate--beta-alanine ligase n=1 Tax=Psychrobacter sp. FDAARGOS_221 TaxID=1975705 RepID=UPI000BB55757|nr:pantoate--beta-alanine ligase [Psychrobacter sp. FDAARGOS_221]PNK61029.1 pantoate--beta-alanine ligase [Psychrobacter sp. FDAARGOS_221]